MIHKSLNNKMIYFSDETRSRVYADRSPSRNRRSSINWLFSLPCQILAWCCAHSFGRHLMYPGSVHLLQFVVGMNYEIFILILLHPRFLR